MTTLKQDPLVFALVLIAGAFLYTRSRQANAANRYTTRAQGAGSVPGNVGSGTAQVVGGVLGSLFTSMRQMNPLMTSGPTAVDPYYLGVSVPVQDIARTDINTNLPGVEQIGDRILFIDP